MSADTIQINKELDEVEVVQERSSQLVNITRSKLVIDAHDIQSMPKFLGTSDPIRYLQSLAGVQTNNETSAGIHIQGCDDYQTLTAINGAPIYYPNHLLGLFSTFIAPHFESIEIEQSEHNGLMENRIGGYVNLT
ncbi:MAG TPA: TonB-dependent receptor, partial [Bacteroidales bacterium]|nr:TonB-dependent receptor [Bacteroidales bacterium]